MHHNKAVFYTVVLTVVLCILAIPACSPAVNTPAPQKTLNLGCIMPFSGPAAMYGERGRQVTDVYIELVNEDGGVKIGDNTYKINLHWGDDGFTPAGAATAARKLIYDDGVSAILGYIGPGFSALSPVTNAEKVMLFSKTGGVIYSPQKDPYVIFGSPVGEITLNQAIAVMQAHPGLHTLAWTGTSDDRRIAESAFSTVDKHLEKEYGIKSVRAYYPAGTTNFTPYLSKMAEQGTQAIFVGGTILEVALIAKQRSQMGYEWPIGHTSDNLPDVFFGICGKPAAQGITGNRINPLELKKVKVAQKYLDMTQKVCDRYQQKYKKPLNEWGTFTEVIQHMSQYFECAQLTGTTDPDVMMKAFKGGTFETFLGKYTFSGTKTYGAPVVCGSPCGMGSIQGDEDVYMGEFPLMDADMWHDYFSTN